MKNMWYGINFVVLTKHYLKTKSLQIKIKITFKRFKNTSKI